ncbi:NADP-dependent oxidoreductase [Falsarthrobacter nasiphocae]|uniref:Alcohol dehydrogenase n=1 Tax=Falsarthrobacter nasiphocae TaxID=189863 RepID=A0AAE4C6M3_9MICC|nr:NADP-dependent oxidoreductase [Falsarthrobacter nasiphocae]MDR6892733.1 alcohol dehydrogenase [Falsarthrobacter nasiphocae]
MKAFTLTTYGAPFEEATLPTPVPGPGQVLVRMAAAGINHADERSRSGQFKLLYRPKLPVIAGSELSGDIVAIGEGVSGFSVGDSVVAYTGVVDQGAWAELALVEAAALARAPRRLSLTEAAALPVAGLTAWQALVAMGDLQPGQRVLIHGGSGGVGTIAIQLAKHLGATVITTVSARNAEFVRSLGADQVIDYAAEDFVTVLEQAPVDLVLDTQGGDITMRSLEVVRRGGLVVGIAGTPDPAMADQAGAPRLVKAVLAVVSARLRRRARRLGVTYRFLFIEPDGAALSSLAGLADEGTLRPVVGRVLPFDHTPEAVQAVLAGGARGKVLVSTDPAAVTADSAHPAAE